VVTKFLAALSIVVASFAPSGLAQSTGNAERGAKLAYTCLGCHAIPNYKNSYPSYRVPKLRGQHAEYLVLALQAYRNGERSHATMYANAAGWTDEQFADMSAFLAGPVVKAPVAAKPVGKIPDAAQTCVACQHADYLERALTDYKKGGRKNAIMSGFAAQLSARDIKTISAYYAAQRPSLDSVRAPARR
jgi:cytochrome c553